MRITVPKLFGGKARRKAPARPHRDEQTRKAPTSTGPRYKGRTADLGLPAYRGNTRLKYGPEGKPARTREQLADRASRRPPRSYGGAVHPLENRPDSPARRPYPAPKVANLRTRPEVRASTRYQLAERRDTLAKSRARKPPQGIGTLGARTQLATRPQHGRQVHTYPEPYERRPARPTPATAPRNGAETGARPTPRNHPARGVAARPSTKLPGDVTPAGRMGGSRVGGDKPHPFFSKRG